MSRTRLPRPLLLAALPLLWPTLAVAGDFYVDPVAGSPNGDGSAQAPWSDLQDVIDNKVSTQGWPNLPYGQGMQLAPRNPGAPVGPGDRILLRDGEYGEIAIRNAYNAQPITIEPDGDAIPRLRSLAVHGGAGWIVRGLSVSSTYAPGGACPPYLVDLSDHNFFGPTHDVELHTSTLFSIDDASGWTADDWNTNACDGVHVGGADITVADNTLRNVNFGISVDGPNAKVLRNLVENFAGDGMRGLGDYGLFEGNVVKNCYDVNDNHDDAFQSWSVGPGGVGTGEVRGVVLRGNIFLNFEDPEQPLRGPLQGIGCFDGMYRDWVVENNLIVVDHYHGISLYGCIDCRIVNNTVYDASPGDPGPPWISVEKHKNGTMPTNVLVRNNLVASLVGVMAPDIVRDFNMTVDSPEMLFVDVAQRDFHLRPDAPAVDAGSSDMAPAIDLDGNPRPYGAGVDIGAYEYTPGGGGSGGDSGPGSGGGSSGGSGPGCFGDDCTTSFTGGSGGDGSTGGTGGGGASEGGAGCGCRSAEGSAFAWLLAPLLMRLRRRSAGRARRCS